MTKIVVNRDFGGFSLSNAAVKLLHEKGMVEVGNYSFRLDPEKRNDPCLIEVVETLGQQSWGKFARLEVVEIPDDVQWVIEEYDGSEWVAEKHRTW